MASLGAEHSVQDSIMKRAADVIVPILCDPSCDEGSLPTSWSRISRLGMGWSLAGSGFRRFWQGVCIDDDDIALPTAEDARDHQGMVTHHELRCV